MTFCRHIDVLRKIPRTQGQAQECGDNCPGVNQLVKVYIAEAQPLHRRQDAAATATGVIAARAARGHALLMPAGTLSRSF